MHTVVIEFMDSLIRRVDHVSSTVVADGVLHLRRDRAYSGGYEHLGSFPLVNIRTYRLEDR